eukprot:6500470-Pyramimonas_sp.AAC.1
MSSPTSSPVPKKSRADEGISDEEPKEVEDPGKVTMGNIQRLLQAELKPVKSCLSIGCSGTCLLSNGKYARNSEKWDC